MRYFETDLQDLIQEARERLQELTPFYGRESIHRADTVLHVPDGELMFNLEGGRYLTELHPECLIDNQGYQYSYESLETEQLCQLVDHFNQVDYKFQLELND